DDALREDEARAMFSRYAKPVGAAVVAGLLGLAGYLWYTNHQEAVAGENGEKFTLALDQVEGGDLAKGNAALAPLLKDAGPGYAGAARLMQGGIAEQQGKAAEAAKIFGEVAADANAPQPYRDLATIRAVAAQFDTLLPQQVVDRLKPLAVPGNPWFGSAGELVGVAYIKQGRGDLAAPLFAAIAKDKGVPDTLRRRIRQIAGQLGVDAVDDPEAAAHAGGQ
ncbi:MAG: hypothetical protein RIS94_2112, partial [Pseudomonadota bacterium]